jgi:hypothetical protein
MSAWFGCLASSGPIEIHHHHETVGVLVVMLEVELVAG